MTAEPLTGEQMDFVAEHVSPRSDSSANIIRRLIATVEARDAEVRRLTDERDALQAMVECCRELVPDLPFEWQDDLAGIVGWPPPARSARTGETTDE